MPGLEIVLKALDKGSKPMAEFGSAFDDINKKIKMFTAGLTGAFAGSFVISKMADMTKQAIEFGSRIEETAKRIGVTADEEQRLDLLSKMAGTNIDALGRAFRQLSTHAYDAATKGGEFEKIFNQLGVTVRDNNGNLKTANQIFNETVLAISGMQSPLERTAAAQKLFGKGAGEVLTVINEGKPALQGMIKDVNDLALRLDDDTVKALDDAKKKTVILDNNFKVLSANIVNLAVPALTSFIDKVNSWTYAFTEQEKNDKKTIEINRHITDLYEILDKLNKGEPKYKLLSYWVKYMGDIPLTTDEAKKKIAELRAELNKFNNPTASTGSAPAPDPAAPCGGSGDGKLTERQKAQVRALQKIEKQKEQYAKETYEKKKKMAELEVQIDQDVSNQKQKIAETDRKSQDRILQHNLDNLEQEKQAKIATERAMQDFALESAHGLVAIMDMIAQASRAHGNKMKAIRIAEVWIDSAAAGASAARAIWSQSGVAWQAALAETIAVEAALISQAVAQTAVISQQKFALGGQARGGMALVGEHGPEAVALPAGARVYNSGDTARMAQNNRPAPQVHIHVTGDDDFITRFRWAVRSGEFAKLAPDIAPYFSA